MTAANLKGRSRITAYWYDALDRQTDAVELGTNGGTDYTYSASSIPARSATALRTTTNYDTAGRDFEVIDPRGKSARSEYDAMGRVITRIQNYESTATLTNLMRDNSTYTRFQFTHGLPSAVTQYDNATVGSGNVVDQVLSGYDDWGQLTSLHQDWNSAVSLSTGDHKSYGYAYDTVTTASHRIRALRRTTISLPGQNVTLFYSNTGNSLDAESNRVSQVRLGAQPCSRRAWYSIMADSKARSPSATCIRLPAGADVDFAKGRLTVRSPKTERWEGHEQRVVPITPKLMTLLQERFEDMPEGDTPLVSIGGKGAVIRPVRRIWTRAGIEPWERLWQTLRSSCEKEWAMTYPQFAVSKWIGHSITVSGKHYANAVPDELFDRVADVKCGVPSNARPASAQRNAQ